MTGDMTVSVHSGNDTSGPAIRTPITMANSYRLPDDPASLDWSGTDQLFYTRNTGANQIALQTKLATMEHAEDAVTLASGVAALHAVFFTFLRTGDHVVVSDTTYEATWKLWSHLLPQKHGIEATFVDIADADAVAAAFTPRTRMLVAETIANPTTKVADIAALAALAHDADALLLIDSTFTPPPLYRPLDAGADLVVHSLTKYINGHGDAMGGAVLGRSDLIDRIRAEAMVDVGGVISPFNAWLIARGAITLPLRLQQHQRTAAHLAQVLHDDPRVAFVAYPGLPSHPQHALAAKQFDGRGFGAMMAFAVRGDAATQNRFVSSLKIITSAVSLGHDESLIVHVGPDGPRVAAYPEDFRRWGHLRFSVGLEDADDLATDLTSALDATFG
ncbi:MULTISPECIES: PLP-dependent aspartate aminotransferase family protein [unclassified Gordonia (in: high G+C Gram-positive bacteria)]|uniref:trans-sulfuration enzyme family protein n=1 Tax=unclassified Gordonia (in: high G+C Gram-positive bacteria) TaxID=2657482 RepID=UPI001F114D3D|nr:aminotransferase class I/II-fold pyridoxal phosphate-dependent enzyme [Gordonia sp. ABSL49_1]MCH5645106.1 aminotransferase class I/II-fold pyridoxal phosphate-dependent enzyme [Gordonia sp. ABSL49_1]